MKNVLYLILTGLLLCSFGCTGVKTEATGLKDEALIKFIGKPGKYRKGLEVQIDDDITFTAEVVRPHSERPKGEAYSIPPGSHLVTITYKDELIYRKKIFVSTRETKKIQLP